MTDIRLSIIIPTYNEQRTINTLVNYVRAVDYPVEYEIIIVDDASIDRTYEQEILLRLRNEGRGRIRLFKNKLNKGKGYSVRKGIHRARGEVIIIQDADEEYDPREIPKLIAPILNGECAAVYGSRFLGNPRPAGMSGRAWLANRFLTRLTNILYGLRLTDMETCYKAFRADVVKGLALRANRFTFEPEVTAKLARKGVKIIEMPIGYHGRNAAQGKKIRPKDFFFAVAALLANRFLKP